MNHAPDDQETREYTDLIVKLESLLSEIENSRIATETMFGKLEEECVAVLTDARARFHNSYSIAEKYGVEIIPDLALTDGKKKKAWIALFRHQRGATADQIAEDLRRHRTTVSTYLNHLVEMGLASKERIGHEVYYKAILKNE
ncbi:MAG TPA: helix-turn-helix domain-containing protein [Methanoregulaceae archaeon]|nr:helix-turn-helix domain-containing protein [Methanoregulaceae archaeon]